VLTDDQSPYERTPAVEGALRQGELLCNVYQVIARTGPVNGTIPVTVSTHPFAIVVTQDCDLDRDWSMRAKGVEHDYGLLGNVLLCEVSTAEHLRFEGKRAGSSMPPIGTAEWKSIRKNHDERFLFLQRVLDADDLQAKGLEELIVHFRRVFVVETDRLYAQLRDAQTTRRCRLRSPYLEHLSNRLAAYWSRVALPRPHESE
jgi:hypothetical protein